MKRTFLVMAMVIGLAMSTMAGAIAGGHDPGIASPTAGEVVYENTLYLSGTDTAAQENNARWAVRGPDACSSSNTEAGNVDGENDDFKWEEGAFTATVDITGWDPGEYCFVLNTRQGVADGSLLIQNFYIVDEYAKVGGVLEADAGRKGNGTHAIEGLVGFAGDAGPVGSIEVNYRALGETCTLTPSNDLAIGGQASGVHETAEVRAGGSFHNSCTPDTVTVAILGRGGVNTEYSDRGAFFVRHDPTESPYRVDIDRDSNQPADNWVPMLKGNNIVVGSDD